MEENAVPNQEKTEKFVGKMLGDVSASMSVMLASIGDRLGLFKELAEGGAGHQRGAGGPGSPGGGG